MSAAPPDQRDEFITARIQEQALAEQLALKDRALDVAAEQPPLRMPGCPLDRGFMPTTGSSA